MSKKYKNSPIVEAICEFRFQPGSAWESSFPDQIHEKVRSIFSQKRIAQSFEATFALAAEGNQQHLKTTARFQAWREDQKALMQIEANLLSISHLKPYPTWQEFLPLIEQAFIAYRAVAEPKGLHRIGLRYINRIEIPGDQIKLEDFFNFFPTLTWQAPGQGFISFNASVYVPFDYAKDILKLQISSGPSILPDALAVNLDLDYFTGRSGEVSFESAFAWIEQAHSRLEDAFEGCITDSLRKFFEEEKE